MARSQKAKELAAQQRAQVKAERARKRNSDDPRDWGTVRQIRETYKITAEVDPKVNLLLALGFLGPVLLGVGLGIWLDGLFLWIFTGIMGGLLVAMMILVQRAKKAAYTRTQGQTGASKVGLGMLPKQWSVSDPIAANKSMDVVFRALGPGGLVLIGEGEPGRLKALLASEARRHEQVAYGITVITLQSGDKPGQIPVDKLAAHIKKLPKALSEQQIAEVRQRLVALDALRAKAPLPQGPLPTSVSRKAMRGR